MTSLYFYEKAGQQAGPVAGDQLVAHGVQASTMVWCTGMTDWVAAETVPELRGFFIPLSPVPPRPAPASSAGSIPPIAPTPTSTPPAQVAIIIGIVLLAIVGVLWSSDSKPDKAEPDQTEQQDPELVQDEIKEIGYAANHPDEVEAQEDRKEEVTVAPATHESDQEDEIESIDNDNGRLTIYYTSGKKSIDFLSDKKEWFFAYSSRLIVVHDERNRCSVRDTHNRRVTEGSTNNDGTCTGLRVSGDHIIIDVDTGKSTHQETYDSDLHFIRRSNVQFY